MPRPIRGHDRHAGRAVQRLGPVPRQRQAGVPLQFCRRGPLRYRRRAPLTPGKHNLAMDFRYDGGGIGKGGTAVFASTARKLPQGASNERSRSGWPWTKRSTWAGRRHTGQPIVRRALQVHRRNREGHHRLEVTPPANFARFTSKKTTLCIYIIVKRRFLFCAANCPRLRWQNNATGCCSVGRR